MKKLLVGLITLSISTTVFATPVASFSTGVTTTPIVSSSEQTKPSVDLSSYPVDTQIEYSYMQALYKELGIPTGLSTYTYNPSLVITEAEYNTIYNERMNRHNNGTNPLPVRYLPNDYDNNMTIANPNGVDRSVLYEVVLGHPIFYKIERYQRPESEKELTNLPNKNSDRLDLSSTGLNVTGTVGTLYLD